MIRIFKMSALVAMSCFLGSAQYAHADAVGTIVEDVTDATAQGMGLDMTKREIVKALAVEFGLAEPTAKRAVQFVLNQIMESIESERRVAVSETGRYAPVEKVKSLHNKTAARLKSKLGDEGVAEARRLQEQHTPKVIRYAFVTLPI